MSEHSSIEWTDATWNPVRGCTKISPGCVHCYAETFAERFRGTINVPGGPAAGWVAEAMAEFESILEQADRPAVYAGLLHAADSRPPAHGALVARTQEQGSAIRNQLLFFDLEWLALDEAQAATVIASPACARWRHHLSSMRRYRKHIAAAAMATARYWPLVL